MSMDESELTLFYPSLIIDMDSNTGKIIIPDVRLPEDYRRRVPLFYRDGGRENIERYTKGLVKVLENTPGLKAEIRLNWTDDEGLRNISIGHGGFDISDEYESPQFREHNLGWLNSIPPFLIATAYVKELLKV